MLDNILNDTQLNLLPGEAFTAAGSFGEKMLDKISDAIGWAVIPKDTKKYRLEAEEYLIEQIKKDEKMPPLAKAAYISKVRKIIKQYVNKCDICTQAMNYLDKNVASENVDAVEDDWLEFFFDKAQNVSKEDIQIIWAKLLAKEFEYPNSVSKQLLHILSVIDYEDATIFCKLVNLTILIDEEPHLIVHYGYFEEFYSVQGVQQSDIFKLVDIGLLQSSSTGYTTRIENGGKIKYFDYEMDIEGEDNIAIGNVLYSKAGATLYSIISDKRKIDGMEKIIESSIGKDNLSFMLSQEQGSI